MLNNRKISSHILIALPPIANRTDELSANPLTQQLLQELQTEAE
jgi:hypothetical protein